MYCSLLVEYNDSMIYAHHIVKAVVTANNFGHRGIYKLTSLYTVQHGAKTHTHSFPNLPLSSLYIALSLGYTSWSRLTNQSTRSYHGVKVSVGRVCLSKHNCQKNTLSRTCTVHGWVSIKLHERQITRRLLLGNLIRFNVTACAR